MAGEFRPEVGARNRARVRLWRAAAAAVTMVVPLTVAVGVGAKERLTAGELRTSADAICARAAEQLDPLFAELFPT